MFHRFCCLGLGLGLVHRPIRVVGRRVERIFNGAVFDVLVTLWYVPAGTTTASPSRTGRSCFSLKTNLEDELGFSLFYPEELVDILVHLVTDFFARSQAHQDKLCVPSRKQYLAEVLVLQSLFFNLIQRIQSRRCPPISWLREPHIPSRAGHALRRDP